MKLVFKSVRMSVNKRRSRPKALSQGAPMFRAVEAKKDPVTTKECSIRFRRTVYFKEVGCAKCS